jgi:WD40 repeat protein
MRRRDFKASVPAIGRLTGHDDFVYCIAFEPPYIFSGTFTQNLYFSLSYLFLMTMALGGADRTIRIWDMRMMGQVRILLPRCLLAAESENERHFLIVKQVKKVLAHKHGVNWLHYRRDLGCRVASVAGKCVSLHLSLFLPFFFL